MNYQPRTRDVQEVAKTEVHKITRPHHGSITRFLSLRRMGYD